MGVMSVRAAVLDMIRPEKRAQAADELVLRPRAGRWR